MPIAEACQVRELPLCWLCRPGGSIIQTQTIIATTLADITANTDTAHLLLKLIILFWLLQYFINIFSDNLAD